MIAKELDLQMTEADIAAALRAMDENGDNEIEFEEFRDWWVLESSQAGADGGPMSVFKKKLAESTARAVMEFDGATFLEICKECNLMGKQDMKTRRIHPPGAVLPKTIEYAFRKAVHEDYDPAAEATAQAEIVRRRKGTLSKKAEELEQKRMNAWQQDRMRVDHFVSGAAKKLQWQNLFINSIVESLPNGCAFPWVVVVCSSWRWAL